MNRSLSFSVFFLFVVGFVSFAFGNTADENNRIAERMLRHEKVTHAEKLAAYPTYRALRAAQPQPAIQPPSIYETDTSGGPDAYGYIFKDQASAGGPTYSWINHSGLDSAIYAFSDPDDGSAGPIGVGFAFQLYGSDFTQLYLGTNGYITTNSSFAGPSGFPWAGASNGVYFWASDMYMDTPTHVYITRLNSPARFMVTYDSLYDYNGGFVSCQIIFNTNGSILVQYHDIGFVSPIVGIQNDNNATNLSYTGTVGAGTAILYSIPCANPTLTTPANSATGITGTSTTLAWAPGLCSVNYDVYISTDSSSVRNMSVSARVASGLSATSTIVPITNGQVYYWLVAGHDALSNIVPSSMFHFGTSAQLTGSRTIGGSTPDYPTFGAALTAVTTNGVGAGGVTFNVRSGTYAETLLVNAIPNASASNPVIFHKQSGTVTISPPVPNSDFNYAVKLNGCSYVTFDGIDIADNSGGTNYLQAGYWISNPTSTQGAQNNTIKNCTIRMRVSSAVGTNFPAGIYQFSNPNATPISTAGANSNNRFLNLKISKAHIGLYFSCNANFPDQSTEIGSEVVGLGNASRFVIGSAASDTIGGVGNGFGIEAQNMGTLAIHDIDVTNMISSLSPSSVTGIYILGPRGATTISNSRFYNITAISNDISFCLAYGIRNLNPSSSSQSVRVYNNMFYAIASTAPGGVQTPSYAAFGVFDEQGNITVDNNSFLLNQLSGPNLLCSTADIYLQSGTDTVRNNIITNYTPNQSSTSYHMGIYNTATSLLSDRNCFYIVNTTNGFIGFNAGSNRATLANWQASQTGIDANSRSGSPQFTATSAPYDLHVLTGRPTSLVEGAATPLSYITTDIDGDTRSVGAPDIGADEGNFLGHSIAFARPLGGENYYISSTDTISWTSYLVAGSVTIQIDRNYPSSFSTIATPFYASTPYLWTVTGPATVNARMKIYDTSSPTVGDTTFSAFSVVAPVSTIARANGGETFYIGTTDSITWTSNFPGNVAIKYNTNYPGGAWNTLVSGIPASQGKYLFTIPNAASTNVRFAVVSLFAPNGNDTSNAALTIKARAMTVTNPTSGQIVTIGSQDTIRWTNTGTYPRTIGISYAGAVPESVLVLNNTLPANSTSYIWSVTGRTSTHARIYLLDTNGIVGWSANDFTVALPALQLSRPNGGETYFRGENDTIRWVATNIGGTVRLELNRSFPSSSWEALDSTTLATQQFWAWNAIAGATSATCRIRIKSNSLAFAIDTSDANFSLVQRTLVLTRPNGGETFRVLANDTIKYNANFITNGIRIELNRTYPGGSWELLVDSVGGNGSFWNWNSISGPISATARVRLTGRGLNNPPYTILSANNFSIQPNPVLYQSTGTINFANVTPHTTDSLLLVIKNQSNLAFHYLTLTGATGRFSKQVMDNDSLTNANDSLRIWVKFTPDTVRSFADTLRMTFESPYNPIAIPISGVGAGTYDAFSTYSISFPTTVEPTRKDSTYVRVYAQGTIPLQNAHWIVIPSNLPYVVSPVNMPSINPNDSSTAWVYFEPTAPGTFTGQVALVSNAINEDTLRLNVTGNSQYVVPATPGHFRVTASGSNALLTWDRVDTTVSGVAVTVAGYNIYNSTNGLQPYTLLMTVTGASNTSYQHVGAITTLPFHSYYRITAYFGSSSDRFIRPTPGIKENGVKDGFHTGE